MKQIYIGNVPVNKTEDDLKNIFSQFGQVSVVQLVKNRVTGDSRGFGFIEMADDASADIAISKLEGASWEGKTLRVNEARPSPARQPRDTW